MRGSKPVTTTLPAAGAWTGVLNGAPISIPSCTAIWPVKGETRLPNPDVIQPFTGQTDGVASHLACLLSMTEDKFCIERSSVPLHFGARQFPLELWRGEG